MSESNARETSVPRVPGFTVHERIGGGGSADVWRASRRGDAPQEVAIKVMREQGPSNRAEWRTLRSNAGPHVVPVLDLLTDAEGRACLVMPYYAGGTLDAVVRGRGGLTVGETVTALAPIASALEALHARSCLHGDVTPSNVLLDADGRPVLADLGAAQSIARGDSAQWASPGFVAPEVLDGEASTAASDVYALGCVLWFCCAVQAPEVEALRPRLDEVVPGLPRPFVELVTSCLSQSPEARPHAQHVAATLMTVADARPVPVGSPAAPGPSATPDSLTRRIRSEAQSRQEAPAAVATARSVTRSMRKNRSFGVGGGRARWAFVLGIAGVGAALAWPINASSGDVRATPARTASPAALPKAGAGVSHVSARPSAASAGGPETPSQPVVQGLLDCRATAWNTGRAEHLEGCLQTGSTAEQQDKDALRRAAEHGIRYASIGYDVTRLTRPAASTTTSGSSGPGAADVTLDAVVTTRAYDVVEGRSRTHVSARSEMVRLSVTKTAAGWRIVGWNVS